MRSTSSFIQEARQRGRDPLVQERYLLCLNAISALIERGGRLNDSTITREMGFPRQSAKNLRWIWNSHPVLGPSIAQYRRAMSSNNKQFLKKRYAEALALQNAQEAKQAALRRIEEIKIARSRDPLLERLATL